MRATAKWNYVKVSPQKARLVADRVRRLDVDAALTALRHINKRTAAQIQRCSNRRSPMPTTGARTWTSW